jgi:hypothetical protein
MFRKFIRASASFNYQTPATFAAIATGTYLVMQKKEYDFKSLMPAYPSQLAMCGAFMDRHLQGCLDKIDEGI